MDLLERAQHYSNPKRRPDKSKRRRKQPYQAPTVPAVATAAQRRRLRHKENQRVAREVAIAEAKVTRLRGAAKKSAQKTLDRLITLFN
jgi:hypothetical protein